MIAIDKMPPEDWEFSNLPDLLDDLLIGDCRQTTVLEQAKIQQCRAVILVTSSEQVTQYQIEVGDTLNGLLLSEVGYGYGVVPILYQKEQEVPKLMPSEDIRLAVGDRMVVLATSNGLRRIEQGISSISLKGWRVQVEKALTDEAVFEGANAIARISGCNLNMARDLMKNLPRTL